METLKSVLSVCFCRVSLFHSHEVCLVTCMGAEVFLFELFTFVGGQSRTGPNAQRQTS